MLGFTDRSPARRWIADAGIICLGAGALWTAGCAGASRDGLASNSVSGTPDSQLASNDDVGHASLADSRPKTKKRKSTGHHVAAGKRRTRKVRPEGDPFLSEPVANRAVAQAKPRSSRPPETGTATPADNTPEKSPEKAPRSGPAQVVSGTRPALPKRPAQTRSTVAANSRTSITRSTAGEAVPTVTTGPKSVSATARSGSPAGKAVQRKIAQVSASSRASVETKSPAETKTSTETPKTKAPVITPAVNEAAGNLAGYERQRADRLMERAHVMLQHNFREEALRLAAVAEQLEKSKQAVYHAGEERPSDLVAQLQQTTAARSTTGSASAAETPRADSSQKRVYQNRSVPEDPRAVASRTGRIVLTDISAGWQAAPESNGSDSSRIEPAAGKTAPRADRNQLAHLETTAKADGREASTVETAPPPSELALADPSSPAPAAVPKDGKAAPETATAAAETDAAAEDSADADPIMDNETPATTVSRWNATTITGLIAGLGGLIGLAFWRRQERKHYAAAAR